MKEARYRDYVRVNTAAVLHYLIISPNKLIQLTTATSTLSNFFGTVIFGGCAPVLHVLYGHACSQAEDINHPKVFNLNKIGIKS